ncbi:hypothetical protein SSX86_026695 [Deinandra increscens subsp. villosa]|uniref:Vacuolar protein sorting-associated protein Ist1 n=1 Tax=Deinandra increscens subsp. villosa TaxID=3103831 RepID=A0AAP0CKB8_9ASTR
MLHKRFKTAKCKTALKLATSRIKLMKNKKAVQINQMKKDLAHLLETGQDRTARIRVEHVIREEKMIAAYELIEIYCELIVARLPIIESQKTCPIDLKEAVTSVIFAAPRCSDISELVDIRKQFTAKYGKEFVSAAIELHPDCGVSRMLVEKLSAVAPDLQTKIKVLSSVAKDHNVNWEPTAFEEKESKPPSDLLNGPVNFEDASMANVDPPKVQLVHSYEEKQNAPFDFLEQNKKYTQSTHNVSSNYSGGETSSPGETYERTEMKQNWNLEFKDATAAAQAAAESAERAALAARAAAQFSIQEKVANHHPTGPHVSTSRYKPLHVSAPLGSGGESSFDDKTTTISNQHIDNQHATLQKATERLDGSTNDSIEDEKLVDSFHVPISRDRPPHVSAPSASSGESLSNDRKSNKLNQRTNQSEHDISQKTTGRFDRSNDDLIEDEKFVNTLHMTDGYFEESMHEDQESSPSPERESKTELFSDKKESIENENINFFATETQSTIPPSHSHFRTSSHEVDGGKKSVVGNPFAVVDQESPFKESVKTAPNVNNEAISDDIDDDDVDVGPRFDNDDDETEATHSLENAYMWSSKVNVVDQPISQSHIFSESISFGDHSFKSVAPSETDNHEPASFDHSDGPDSESESELLSLNPEPSSVVESSQTFDSKKSRIELNDLVEGEPSSEDEEKQMQSQYELKKHNFDQEPSDTLEDNNDSLNQRLNIGALTGGLRNKGGLRYPPYTKSATIEKSTEESSLTESQTSVRSSLDSRVSRREDEKPKAYLPVSDSDSDSNEKATKQANTRSLFSPPAAFFSDNETDSEDEVEVAKQVPNKIRLGSGLSRRTRGSPSISNSKTDVNPKPGFGPVPETVIPAEPRAYARRFKVEDDEQISEQQQPFSPFKKTVETGKTKLTSFEPQVNHSAHTKQEAVKIMPEAKYPMDEHVTSRIAVESGKLKNAKTQNSGSESSSGENLVNKPSHVHPKLPEYDSLAARLQSLRTGRQ